MLKNCRAVFKVSGIYIATVIGAGFASGREIVQFFSGYYSGGFYGILLAGLLFALIGWLVLDRVYCERIRNYEEFIYPLLGYHLGKIMELAVTFFMMCLYTIMMAGLANITVETTGLPYLLCIIPIAFLAMLFILNGIKGVMAVSSFLTPLLSTGIILIGFYIILTRDTTVFKSEGLLNVITDSWIFSSLLYVGYNSIMAVMVMCGLQPYLKNRKIAVRAGIIGGGTLCFIALILNAILSIFYPGAALAEMPVLYILQKYSSILAGVYTSILWAAMFVSAVTSGYCFVERLSKRVDIDTRLLTAIVCTVSIPMAGMGFSRLIAEVYPIFGYIGMFLVLVILLQAFASHINYRISGR